MTRRELIESWGLVEADHYLNQTRYDDESRLPDKPAVLWADNEWWDTEVEDTEK